MSRQKATLIICIVLLQNIFVGQAITVPRCEYSDWEDVTPCSVSCGTGTKLQNRNVTQVDSDDGKLCGQQLVRTKNCTLIKTCPTDPPTHSEHSSSSFQLKPEHVLVPAAIGAGTAATVGILATLGEVLAPLLIFGKRDVVDEKQVLEAVITKLIERRDNLE